MSKNKTADGGVNRERGRSTFGPLVSIITVSLNSEKTIAKTIESVLSQSYAGIEYIIIDGASTDRTMDILKQYEPRFKGRMRWISKKDNGIYDAMNKGIEVVKGEIVGLINSDDWYEPDAVKLVAQSYQKHGEAVYYGIVRIMEDGKEVMLKAVSDQFLHREVLAHPAYFVPKSIYQKYGLFRLDYKYASDYELMMRLINSHVRFVQIDRILATFNQGGKSSQHGLQTLEEFFKIRHFYGYIAKRAMLYQIMKYRILYRLRELGFDM
jgi:glycosyltransferase involved in cell wall biosynthesis